MERLRLKEDFDYFYEQICKHPSMIKHQNEEDVRQVYLKGRGNINDISSLIMEMTKMTMLFQDGHTNIEIPYSENSLCLNIPCEWSESKEQAPVLVLTNEWHCHQKGEIVSEINGISTSEMIEKFNNIIPHENRYLVMSRMLDYPYENYHIFSLMNLRYLFGATRDFDISFLHNGEMIHEKYAPEKYNGFLDFCDDEFLTYEESGDTVTVHLNSCICNDIYRQTLYEIAVYCKKNSISTLVFDLSKNMGGDSSVIDEFIRRTPTEKYHRYEMIDYSSGVPVVKESRCREIVNDPYEDLFPTNIICKVGHATFSSARTFAVTLKDNGIAKIIGVPTGGKPNSYGMPKKYITPHCKIRFRVSRCEFLRPNSLGDLDISLFPDEV